MQIIKRRTTTLLFVLCTVVIASLAVPDEATAAEGSTGRYVFEYCHTGYGNSTSQPTYDGFYIDSEGVVWSYEHGDQQWSPGRSDGPFYEYELHDKYGTVKQVGTVDKPVLSAMASLIESANGAEPAFQGRLVAGMDSMTYRAYLYDAGQDMYKEVVLSVRGSGAAQNASSSAKNLVSWLESVFFKGSPSNPPEPVHPGMKPSEAGAAAQKLRVIQKIPAPKPKIKSVEIRGPFPIEDPSK
jgi:hypothetical protein